MDCLNECMSYRSQMDIGKLLDIYAEKSGNTKSRPYNTIFEYNEISLNDNYGKILVLQFGRLGESLWALPVLRKLSERFPGADIKFVVSDMLFELLKNTDTGCTLFRYEEIRTEGEPKRILIEKLCGIIRDMDIDSRTLVVNLGRTRESFAFAGILNGMYGCMVAGIMELPDGRTRINGNRYTVLSAVFSTQKINVFHEEKLLEKKTGIGDGKNICTALRQGSDRKTGAKTIGISIGASNPIRMWGPAKYKALAMKLIKKYDARICFFGTAEERSYIGDVNVLGDNVLDFFGESVCVQAGKLEKCGLLICGDSGMMHLASALNVDTVIISGPALPHITGAMTGRNIAVMADIECMPCYQTNCDSLACMKGITVEDVLAAAEYVLEGKLPGIADSRAVFLAGSMTAGYTPVPEREISAGRIAKETINACVCRALVSETEDTELTVANISSSIIKSYGSNFNTDEVLKKLEDSLNALACFKDVCDEYSDVETEEGAVEDTVPECINEFGAAVYNMPYYIKAIFEFVMIYKTADKIKTCEGYRDFMKSMSSLGDSVSILVGEAMRNLQQRCGLNPSLPVKVCFPKRQEEVVRLDKSI